MFSVINYFIDDLNCCMNDNRNKKQIIHDTKKSSDENKQKIVNNIHLQVKKI